MSLVVYCVGVLNCLGCVLGLIRYVALALALALGVVTLALALRAVALALVLALGVVALLTSLQLTGKLGSAYAG